MSMKARNKRSVWRNRTALLAVAFWCAVAGLSTQSHAEEPITDVRNARKAVVTIMSRDASGEQFVQGTGFFISADGRVVTNYHVVGGVKDLAIRLYNGAFLLVERILAKDEVQDLAVLKVDAKEMPFLKLGDSDKVKQLDDVVAIGTPKGLEGTFSKGIISAIRVVDNKKVFQTDTAISSGSSGGPLLLKSSGEVIGVNTMTRVDGQNLNFSVTINTLKQLLLRPLVEKSSRPEPHTVLIVSKLGRGQYKTISAAIEKAKPGTRILVRPGIYYEGLVIDKPLEIVGDGQSKDIVIESADSNCIVMRTDYAEVRGLTLRCTAGSKGNKFYAVNIPQGRLVLEDCDITSDSFACIMISGSTANPIIRNCTIHDGQDAGVVVRDKSKATLEGCNIFGNATVEVGIGGEANPIIRNCTIHDGQTGIVVLDNGKGRLEDCKIFKHANAGVEIVTGGDPVIRNCKIYDGKSAGVVVYENGKGTLEGCNIFGNAKGGLMISENGDPVIRNCKIYNGKASGVHVSNKGKGKVEDCDIFGNALAGVMIVKDGDPVIRNCTIHEGMENGILVAENGKGTLEFCDIFKNVLPGVEIRTGGDPLIRDCKIHDGLAGIMVHDNGKGTVEDCEIFGNVTAGVAIRTSGDPTIRKCRINGNIYAIFSYMNGKGTVENCDLTGNAQGAFDITADSRVIRSGNTE